jgi:hypothetical protein
VALKQHFGGLIFKDDPKVGTVMTLAENTGHGLVYEREQKSSSHYRINVSLEAGIVWKCRGMAVPLK